MGSDDRHGLEGGSPPSAELAIGDLVADRFRVVGRVAEGGSGALYRATQLELKRDVALKLLRRDIAADDEAVARFRHEAQQLAGFSHPGVPAVYDFGYWHGHPYLAFAFVKGLTLRELLVRPLPLATRLRLVLQICGVLAAVHRAGLIHRDLKPENVIVSDADATPPTLTLVDFGLAIAADAFRSGERLTRDGRVSGTPHYMSPEHAQGKILDARSDLYALGVVLYEAACGVPPFDGTTAMLILTQHVFDTPLPPSQRNPDEALPAALDQLALWMLAKEADQRPANAEQVAQALRQIIEQLEAPAADESLDQLTRTPGSCRSCHTHGTVGQPCLATACQDAGQHFLPETYATAHRFDPLIGRKVDTYLIAALIARGGFSNVYMALQPPLMMRVALKVMNPGPDDAATARGLEMFAREAVSLSQMNHPNIVRLLQYGRIGDRSAYLAMEFVDNTQTLRDRLAEGALPREAVWQVASQLLNALEYAHQLGFIHRDIKPENVLLCTVPGYPYHVRLLDFGLVKFFGQTFRTRFASGTPQYLAPEQVQADGQIGPWTDIYAFAVMLAELLGGRSPFPNTDLQQIFEQKLDPQVRWLNRFADLPTVVRAFLRCALAPDPKARFQDVALCRQSLLHCVAKLSLDPSGPLEVTGELATPLSPPAVPTTRLAGQLGPRHLPLLLVILLLCVTVGAAFLLVRRYSEIPPTTPNAPQTVASQPLNDAGSLTPTIDAVTPPTSDRPTPKWPALGPPLPNVAPKSPRDVRTPPRPPTGLSAEQLIGRWRILDYAANRPLLPTPRGGELRFLANGRWEIESEAHTRLTFGTWQVRDGVLLATQEALPQQKLQTTLHAGRLTLGEPISGLRIVARRLTTIIP